MVKFAAEWTNDFWVNQTPTRNDEEAIKKKNESIKLNSMEISENR